MKAIEEFFSTRHVKVISYDYSKDTDRYIRNRLITATLIQYPKQQGYFAVKTALGRLLDPKNFVAEKFQHLPTGIFFLENLDNLDSWYV